MMLEQRWYNRLGSARLGSARLGALLVTFALLAWMLFAVPPAGAQTVDYDTDDDRLIEVDSLAKLNAIRYDVDGDGLRGSVSVSDWNNYTAAGVFPNAAGNQCDDPSTTGTTETCAGYELTASLTFPSSGQFSTWTPLGALASRFTATFDGQGHTLTGLTASSGIASGLFGAVGSGGVIRNLGVINATAAVSSNGGGAGAVAGIMFSGSQLYSSYATGGAITAAADNAGAGGLVGALTSSTIRASYSTNAVTVSGAPNNSYLGGLVGTTSGTIIASYAAGAVSGAGGTGNAYGGLVGRSTGAAAVITNSYCDRQTTGPANCVGFLASGSTVTAAGHTTADLRRPTGYTGIYLNWNIDADGDSNADDPWDFGKRRDYPLLKIDQDGDGTATWQEFGGQYRYIPPPPSPPPYNPAHDHPEIYQNARYEMATSCAVETTGEGDEAKSTSTITFDLGSYTRPLTLALSLWDGTHFRSLQSQGIAMPELRQEGQTATVEVVTDPAQTRFRLDSQYGLNLVLGYADCHTDDP